MRAVVLESAGDASILVVRDGVPAPEPQGEEVRVRVRAFGVNRADVLQRRGRYPAPPDAITGASVRSATDASKSRLVPPNVPSLVTSVTTNREHP